MENYIFNLELGSTYLEMYTNITLEANKPLNYIEKITPKAFEIVNLEEVCNKSSNCILSKPEDIEALKKVLPKVMTLDLNTKTKKILAQILEYLEADSVESIFEDNQTALEEFVAIWLALHCYVADGELTLSISESPVRTIYTNGLAYGLC